MNYKIKCDCPLWADNIDKVNGPLLLEQARNPERAKGYEGERFHFCPWCGQRLFLAHRTAETVSATPAATPEGE